MQEARGRCAICVNRIYKYIYTEYIYIYTESKYIYYIQILRGKKKPTYWEEGVTSNTGWNGASRWQRGVCVCGRAVLSRRWGALRGWVCSPGPVHHSSVIFLAVCLSVCLFSFCRFKGKHHSECPPPPAHEGPWLTLFIYTLKGDTVNLLTLLASGLRGFGDRRQSRTELSRIWRGGLRKDCRRSAESSSHWHSPPGLLGAEIPFAAVPASLGTESTAQNVNELKCFLQTLLRHLLLLILH